MVERSAHNRLVAGSIPAEPRTIDVLSEDFGIREMLEVLMGSEGKRKLRLRHKTNDELFALYDSQLVLKHRSIDALAEARRFLGHYRAFLGQYPPSPELAASFLAKFSERKPNTLYRYHSIIQGFQTWYGESLDSKIKVPQTLPDYIEDTDLDKLKAAMASKKTHKKLIERNLLIIETMRKTGLRRKEVASLCVRDINLGRQYLVARMGKGQKDRIIDLSPALIEKLEPFLKGKAPEDSVFGITAETISGLIHFAAVKAGVRIHAHSLRDVFATRLVDHGTDIEVVRRLLGHTDLKNTQRYLARTDKQRRDAVMSLDSPPPTGEIEDPSRHAAGQTPLKGDAFGSDKSGRKKPGSAALGVPAVVSSPEMFGESVETKHKAEVRQLARSLAERIALPSFTDKELWRQLPLSRSGVYHLPLGTATVSSRLKVSVQYGTPFPPVAPHLKKSLDDHFRSCGIERFSGFFGDSGSLSNWSVEVGQYSQSALSLLKQVVDKIRIQRPAVLGEEPNQPGLTKWFAVMAWHDILERALGRSWLNDSWYCSPERVGDLWLLKCGAYDISWAPTAQTLSEDRDYHKDVRSDRELMMVAQGIVEQHTRLEATAERLRGLMKEFGDLERVPGQCDLCALG